MLNKNEKKLLQVIRYSPSLFILIACLVIFFITYSGYQRDLKLEKLNIEKQFILDQNKRVQEAVTNIYAYIQEIKNNSEEILRKDLQSKINNVYKIAMNIYLKNKDSLSKDEIIMHIKNSVEILTFNEGRGYFSIHTIEGINVLNPVYKAYEGTSVLNRIDSSGQYTIRKAINIAKTKGEGFMTWYSYKPTDKTKEFKKIGIIKKFEPYDLIITTAEYTEDFENTLKKRALSYIEKFRYENNKYVAVIEQNGKILYHPSPKLQDKNIFLDGIFSHVKPFYRKLVDNPNNHADLVFKIKLKVQDTKVENEIKTIYSLKYDSWKWLLSSGFNMSEINALINQRKEEISKKYEDYIKKILLHGVSLTFILMILSFLFSRKLEDVFVKYKANLEKQIVDNLEQKNILLEAQKVAHIGNWKLNINTWEADWSKEIFRIIAIKKSEQKIGIKFLKTIMHEDDIQSFQNSILRCIETGTKHQSIYRIYRPDGKIRWIDCRGVRTKDKKFVVGTIQDITESKTLESEKQQKEEILYQQSKMAAMGEMLGNIAHQWRQPLSVISTASTGVMLQKEIGVLTEGDLKNTMKSINESAQYLSQTIEDFRGFFDPTNKKLEEFSIESVMQKTLKLVNAQFVSKDIEVIEDIEDYKILSLENGLIQVLVNILNNSKDILLLKEEGERLIFIKAFIKNKMAYIEILDNGNGIQEDIIDRIFEPYFTTKHKSQGTGIGLYMSQEIIQSRLNGKISVSNEIFTYRGIEQKGAKFKIILPIK